MIHTIISLNDVFAGESQITATVNPQQNISQFFSTNPRDYLDIV